MIEYLESIDIELFKILNGLHNGFFDQFMWLVSGKFAWVLMCVVLLYVTFKKGWKNGLTMILLIALTITICDQISSTVIKHAVERLRPTRTESLIPIVHTVNGYIGGMYGFVSSHAANSFGVAMLLSFLMRKRSFTISIFLWAVLLSYSRIYLGVHFPGDILGGAIVGMVVGFIVSLIYDKIGYTRYGRYIDAGYFSDKDVNTVTYSIYVNMCGLLMLSIGVG